jgi:hypothetical protein
VRGAVHAATVLALAIGAGGCPTVDLGDDPPEPGLCRPSRQYFDDVIWPQYLAPGDAARSCVAAAGCHNQSNGRSALRLQVEPLDLNDNYAVVTRFLNCGSPGASPLLTKPLSGIESHGGEDLFDPGSAEETTFLDWFGAQ